MDLEQFNQLEQYKLDKYEKNKILFELLIQLTKLHYDKCESYRKILEKLNVDINKINSINEIPYIPVRLFKDFDLKSVPDKI